MPDYYTEAELRQRAGGVLGSVATESLRLQASAASGPFDVFLSHSVRDSVVILGLRNLLSGQGLRVYVDWLDDPALDRSRVSPATASRLRERMRESRSFVYATSRSAQQSRWMPWELGYFDGMRDPDRVSILPIEGAASGGFDGQEYLGLYKVIEKVRVDGTLAPYVVHPSRSKGESLSSFGRARGEYRSVRES